jgi:hypothetical protein
MTDLMTIRPLKKGDEQTGIALRMDATTERFTWPLGKSSLDLWRKLIPDTHFGASYLNSLGVCMLSDDEAKLRNDWQERINWPATLLYAREYQMPPSHLDVQISGDVLIVGLEVWGDGWETGLTKRQLALLELMARRVKDKLLTYQ